MGGGPPIPPLYPITLNEWPFLWKSQQVRLNWLKSFWQDCFGPFPSGSNAPTLPPFLYICIHPNLLFHNRPHLTGSKAKSFSFSQKKFSYQLIFWLKYQIPIIICIISPFLYLPSSLSFKLQKSASFSFRGATNLLSLAKLGSQA